MADNFPVGFSSTIHHIDYFRLVVTKYLHCRFSSPRYFLRGKNFGVLILNFEVTSRYAVKITPLPLVVTELRFSMAVTLSVHPDRLSAGSVFTRPAVRPAGAAPVGRCVVKEAWRGGKLQCRRRLWRFVSRVQADGGGGGEESAPVEMSVENALKLLGVSEGASFDDILRAKKLILATCKDDKEAVAQV